MSDTAGDTGIQQCIQHLRTLPSWKLHSDGGRQKLNESQKEYVPRRKAKQGKGCAGNGARCFNRMLRGGITGQVTFRERLKAVRQ